MKSNKSLVLGTVLAAAGVSVCMGTSEAKADSVYTVQKGDTIYKISRKFAGNTSLVQAIIEKNNIQNPNFILVGQKITVPDNANDVTPVQKKVAPAKATTYKAAPKAQTYVAPKAAPAKPKAQVSTYKVAPKAQTYVAPKVAPAKTQNYQVPARPANSGEASAKAWIANKESTNNYNARNGRYIGKYQLDASYLNGDYSAANQERVAERYVKQRYGSWQAAQAFHQSHGWY